jgi:hypothetical protein
MTPTYRLITVTVAFALLAIAVSAHAQEIRKIDDNLVEVVVVGQGMDKQEALSDARRKAVETGAGTQIWSESQTKDFVLAKDTILARASGFVQSVEVMAERQSEDGVWALKVKAVVSIKGIEDAWGVTTNLLQQMGRPMIMVFVDEKIGNEDVPDSTVQARIENLLLETGFRLVNKNQLSAIDLKDLQSALAEDRPDKAQAIAKRFGAQLFISGTAHATQGARRPIGGLQLFRYEAEANIKCYRSDTAQLLSSIPGESTAGVARVDRSAAKMSLDNQAKVIAPKVRNDILRFWQDALEGRGEVILEVASIPKMSQYFKLKRELAKIKGVKSVNGEFHNGAGRFRMDCDVNAEKVAERVSEILGEMVEISDLSQNVIKADFVTE